MDGVEPESFFEGGVRAEPFLEVMVGGLPVVPTSGDGTHGAGFGAEIVNIKWCEDKSRKIIEDEFGVFGEIEFGVKVDGASDVATIEFIDGRIHSPIDGEKIEKIGFFRLAWFASTKRFDIDIFGGVLAKTFVMDATNGDGSVFRIRPKEIFDKGRLDEVVAIYETNKSTGGF